MAAGLFVILCTAVCSTHAGQTSNNFQNVGKDFEALMEQLDAQKTEGELGQFFIDKMEAILDKLMTQKLRDMEQVQGEKLQYSLDGQTGQQDLQKRADDYGSLETVVNQLSQQLNDVTAKYQALRNEVTALSAQDQTRGTTYVRWGHASCPSDADTVYSGFVGGSHYSNLGGAANTLCLPHNPVITSQTHTGCNPAALHGAEYDTCPDTTHDLDPTCALCHIPRSSSAMIAGTNKCWSGWRLEYTGYLMAGDPKTSSSSDYICVDQSFSYMEGTENDHQGHLLHYTIYHCSTLPCPPYQEGKIVLCAVCSK